MGWNQSLGKKNEPNQNCPNYELLCSCASKKEQFHNHFACSFQVSPVQEVLSQGVKMGAREFQGDHFSNQETGKQEFISLLSPNYLSLGWKEGITTTNIMQ